MPFKLLGALAAALLVMLHLITRYDGLLPIKTPGSDPLEDVAAGSPHRDSWTYEPFRIPGQEATQESKQFLTQDMASADWPLDLASGRPVRDRRSRSAVAAAEELFRSLDLNGDGVLDDDEMTTLLRLERGKWDANKDGTIDLDEFLKYFRARVEQMQTGSGTRPVRTATRADRLSRWFREMDTDNDGQIALFEWKAAGRSVEEFRRLDSNGDGFLTLDEVRSSAALEATRAGTASPSLASRTETGQGSAGLATAPSVAPGMAVGGFVQAKAARKSAPTMTADQLEARHVSAAAARPPLTTRQAPAANRKPVPVPPAPVVYTDDMATVALPLNDGSNGYWTARNQQNDARLFLDGHANVLFLGDSITDGLSVRGKSVWDEFFAPLDSDNFAISGLTTSQVLWQVETGRVALASPNVVVLMIGTNNLGLGQSPPAVAAGISKIVNEIRDQLPRTQILLLGILPRGQSPADPVRTRIAQVNDMIATLEDESRVTFLDIGSRFLQPDGTISPAVLSDYVHPSLWGYQIYTASIWNPLLALLGQE